MTNSPTKNVSEANRNIVLKSINLRDWIQTPTYKIEIDGQNAVEAVVKSCPEF